MQQRTIKGDAGEKQRNKDGKNAFRNQEKIKEN
jgi:hypothetical protein